MRRFDPNLPGMLILARQKNLSPGSAEMSYAAKKYSMAGSVVLLAILVTVLAGVSCSPAPTPATKETALLADWENLGFGMFIHFGMSTFTGLEFGEVPTDSTTYAPPALDVDQWVRVARDAGMKYVVLTSKHCYGHALWDSAVSDYDVATSSNTTDVIRLFTDACRKYGIKPGFYYLLGWDKHNQKIMNPEEYEKFCLAQIGELLTGYGPITELWLDIPWDMGPDTDRVLSAIYRKVKSLQPECLVLHNQGFVDGSAVTERAPTFLHKEFGKPPVLLWPKDLINGEVTPPPAAGHNPRIPVGGKTYYLPMETCDTLAHHWFWETGDSLKSVRTLASLYGATVLKGANLLLDLAPDRNGRIPEATVQRLMEMKAAIADPSLIRPSLTFGAKATASSVLKNEEGEFAAGLAIDDDSGTRWATNDGTEECWLEVDIGSLREFEGAFISEDGDRIREFAIEVRMPDGKWAPFYKGGAIGVSGADITFPKTSGQVVRLHIFKASGGPAIWDFELFGK
jgi:alpha-L-fucosidase